MNPRELPIIFTAESVRAILANMKSQTRRVILWPEWASEHDKIVLSAQRPCTGLAYYVDGRPRLRFTPRFRIGDVLWVKEEWRTEELGPGEYEEDSEIQEGTDGIRFRADDSFMVHENTQAASEAWLAVHRRGNAWRSPLYMPRWASRIAREVTEVRAQRVQEISEEDAIAEGYAGSEVETPREQFAAAWDNINGRRSPWARNDFVFAYTFRRVEK